ncbi:hypothetical protein SKAU_G00072400 [Synaphobranchus kaupii]|uniref:Uncharacterized protein n=1 Tax=Synaphobranchus kaupii TaxID=118154 RepID=A0A9Q1G770_SYNKA|nr:hypothetical protein SKAU_G00072400 [Synaphobranchus kaupii]
MRRKPFASKAGGEDGRRIIGRASPSTAAGGRRGAPRGPSARARPGAEEAANSSEAGSRRGPTKCRAAINVRGGELASHGAHAGSDDSFAQTGSPPPGAKMYVARGICRVAQPPFENPAKTRPTDGTVLTAIRTPKALFSCAYFCCKPLCNTGGREGHRGCICPSRAQKPLFVSAAGWRDQSRPRGWRARRRYDDCKSLFIWELQRGPAWRPVPARIFPSPGPE